MSGLRAQQENRLDNLYSQKYVSVAKRTETQISGADDQIKIMNIDITDKMKQSNTINDSIASYDQKILTLKSSDISNEVGPYKFVADLTGVPMNSVVNIVALLIVLVFDPLAIALLIGVNQLTMIEYVEEKKKYKLLTEEDDDENDEVLPSTKPEVQPEVQTEVQPEVPPETNEIRLEREKTLREELENIYKEISEYENSVWDVTLQDGLENEPEYALDDVTQIEEVLLVDQEIIIENEIIKSEISEDKEDVELVMDKEPELSYIYFSGNIDETEFDTQIKKNDTQTENNFSNPDTLKIGMIVDHQRFGIGEIVDIEYSLSGNSATVLFENVGEKQLSLKYAKLKIIELDWLDFDDLVSEPEIAVENEPQIEIFEPQIITDNEIVELKIESEVENFEPQIENFEPQISEPEIVEPQIIPELYIHVESHTEPVRITRSSIGTMIEEHDPISVVNGKINTVHFVPKN